MRWLFLLMMTCWSLGVQAGEKTVMEQRGFKLEVVDADTPQSFSIQKGVAHFVLKSPATTSFRLTNTSSQRVQVLFTFNRLNPMTGRVAVLRDNGFVLDPQQVLVITQGRLSKRKKDKPVHLFSTTSEGFFHFAVFQERTDYPLILPSMNPPPYGPENFVVENGVRRWVPPARYPFRRLQERPNYSFYATYGR